MAKFIVETTVEVYSPEVSKFRVEATIKFKAETTIEVYSPMDWNFGVKMNICGEKMVSANESIEKIKKTCCVKPSRKNAVIKGPYGKAQKTTVQKRCAKKRQKSNFKNSVVQSACHNSSV